MRCVFCLALLCAVSLVHAQEVPAPGTGVYTWQRVGTEPHEIISFSFNAPGLVYGLDNGSVLYTYRLPVVGEPTAPWTQRPGPRVTATFFPLTADTLLASSGSGVYISRSVDGGATWTDVTTGTPDGGYNGPSDPDGFALVPPGYPHAGRILAGGRLLHSDDRGATWQRADISAIPPDGQGVRDGVAAFFAPLPSGRILFGGYWGIGYSDDGGDAFALTPLWGVYNYRTFGAAALATPGSRQAAEATGTAPACGLADGALCDGAVAVGSGGPGGGGPKAWWTNDGGRTWSAPVLLPEPYDGVSYSAAAGVVSVGVGPAGRGRAVAVLARGTVVATQDGGVSWQAVGRLPMGDGGDLVAHVARFVRLGPDGHLWVATSINGTDRGWLYRSAEPASAAFAVSGEAGPAEAPGLGVSVRPNPARGRVEVTVTLAEAGPVRVVVVDALGRETAVVLDGAVSAGETARGVDTSSWSPGVYVVRATAAGVGGAGARAATARLVVAR